MRTLDEDYNITCPSGDTGLLHVYLTDMNDKPLPMPIDGVAVFAVCQPIQASGGFNTINYMEIEIVDNIAIVNIDYDFSSKLTPNKPQQSYYWDIRVVTNPEFDGDGKLIYPGSGSEVHSVYAGQPGGMHKYLVPGVATDVGRGSGGGI